MLLTLLSLAFASGPTLPEIRERDGLPAAREALDLLVSQAKNDKKLQQALNEADLAGVKISGETAFGASLVLSEVGFVHQCVWRDRLVCDFFARATSPVSEGEYQLQCVSKYGAKKPLESTIRTQADGIVTWQVTGVEGCWELAGAKLQIMPTSHDDLEGIGKGDDNLIPPELAGLTWDRVESDLLARVDTFKICARKAENGVNGKLVVAFHIGEDGRIDRAVAETSTLSDAAVEACILDRFLKIQFPPTHDGFTDGTFPFSFQ